MNAREAAARIGASERTVRRWIHSGRLRATRRYGEFVIDPVDLDEAVSNRPERGHISSGELRGRYFEVRERARYLERELAEAQRRIAQLEVVLAQKDRAVA
jgi:excisionase family DNA binding protein